MVSDTPESKGLPSVQKLSGEVPKKEDMMPTKEVQKLVLKHPGIWVIALSSAFIYIIKYLYLVGCRGSNLSYKIIKDD